MSGVLAILEQQGGAWNRMSLETLAAARQLAEAMGVPASAAVLGHGVAALAAGLGVQAVDHELLARYTPDAFTAAVEQVIRQAAPAIVLLPHTYQVRDFAPKLATRFEQALISDCTGFRVDAEGPVFVRQLFQGRLNADVRPGGQGPWFVSIQAGAFRADENVAGQAAVESFAPVLDASVIRTRPGEPFREAERAVDLTAAEIIVSVGRGIREKDNIAIVEELARALGAELAASRPICDNGWLPMERQVGSSGQTVSPKVYIAVGISGAIQHLVGMKSSKVIVAINKDPEAPIFEVADYGIAGDLFEVVPALTEAVKKARG
ncbi:MAG: electron transfer flavoprotein subunit alpha/FixB family protein [Bryobacteraceae bacterium]|jgi:electron transfer flavoprotein alpha subunit